MFKIIFVTPGGQSRGTVVPDATTAYAANAAVRARKDCDSIITTEKVSDEAQIRFNAILKKQGEQAACRDIFAIDLLAAA